MRAAILVAAFAAFAQAQAPASENWRLTLDRLAGVRDSLSARLTRALADLRPRVVAERPDLLPKLDGAAPPKPLPTGYGLLPEIGPDSPEVGPDAVPSERRYDIPYITDWVAREDRFVDALTARLAKKEDVAPLVDEYLLRRENFRRLDDQIKYQYSWQPEATRSAAYFARLNGLLAVYRVWSSTSASQEDRAAARKRLEDELLQFTPSPGVALERAGAQKTLKVPLQTDIEDEAFLRKFQEGVEDIWNRSAAMKEAGLRVRVDWRRRAPKELYPEGPPAKGAPIDVLKHLDRFGPGALILTTGAGATQAYPTRAIILGSSPIGIHSLAHEFGHILGFSDGYLRAFDGSAQDPMGVTWYEITPFPEDLLSNPGAGRVTAGMVRRLLAGYDR